MSVSEHDVHAFLRVQSMLGRLDKGIPVSKKEHLSKALEKLSCYPFMSLSIDNTSTPTYTISIEGEPAGSFNKPDMDVISKKSVASPFGKGEETVMDETYRRGKEIPAGKIEIADEAKWLVNDIQKEVSAAMFVRRKVQLKLYKLVVYTDGGHFDFHMDSTHSDNHHATVLLALNTSWTGGDLVLKRNGVEMRFGMHPNDMNDGHPPLLQMVAFYTDTEHKVEKVTEGVRIVLQYDVEVVGWSKGKESKDSKDTNEGEKGVEESEEESDEEDKSNPYEFRTSENPRKRKRDEEETYEREDGFRYAQEDFELPRVRTLYSRRKSHKENATTSGDPEVVKEIIRIIEKYISPDSNTKVKEVGFALQYLYRKSSILPQFLKGSDALLYEALAKSFDVSLHPVVLQESTDYEGAYESCRAYRFDQTKREGDGDSSDEEMTREKSHAQSMYRRQVDESTIFHVPMTSAIKQISSQDYVEHMGNEALPGEFRYFGGGMFVRRKEGA
jgi:hypothetical protein